MTDIVLLAMKTDSFVALVTWFAKLVTDLTRSSSAVTEIDKAVTGLGR